MTRRWRLLRIRMPTIAGVCSPAWEGSPFGIAFLNADGHVVDSNEAMQSITGYDADELALMPVAKLHAPGRQSGERRELPPAHRRRDGLVPARDATHPEGRRRGLGRQLRHGEAGGARRPADRTLDGPGHHFAQACRAGVARPERPPVARGGDPGRDRRRRPRARRRVAADRQARAGADRRRRRNGEHPRRRRALDRGGDRKQRIGGSDQRPAPPSAGETSARSAWRRRQASTTRIAARWSCSQSSSPWL